MGTTCETWSDHDLGGPRIEAVGTHPTQGTFHRLVRVCSRCGRLARETRWVTQENASIVRGASRVVSA